jgi:hypothetical protein
MIAQQSPILEKAADSGNGRATLATALRITLSELGFLGLKD